MEIIDEFLWRFFVIVSFLNMRVISGSYVAVAGFLRFSW